MRVTDAADCARLHAQAFTPSWSAEDITDQVSRADRVMTAAIAHTTGLCGFAASRIVADEADLLTIVVDRKARHAGFGGSLLAHHLSALTAARVASVFLEVGTANPEARALYVRFGFTTVGKRKGYYATNAARDDALVMRLDL